MDNYPEHTIFFVCTYRIFLLFFVMTYSNNFQTVTKANAKHENAQSQVLNPKKIPFLFLYINFMCGPVWYDCWRLHRAAAWCSRVVLPDSTDGRIRTTPPPILNLFPCHNNKTSPRTRPRIPWQTSSLRGRVASLTIGVSQKIVKLRVERERGLCQIN